MFAQNRLKAEQITQALQPLAQHAQVKHFRQQGMMWAFDAVFEEKMQPLRKLSRVVSSLKH